MKNWRKILVTGLVAGMVAFTGCSSNLPETNQGNRNGQRVVDAVNGRTDTYNGVNRTRGFTRSNRTNRANRANNTHRTYGARGLRDMNRGFRRAVRNDGARHYNNHNLGYDGVARRTPQRSVNTHNGYGRVGHTFGYEMDGYAQGLVNDGAYDYGQRAGDRFGTETPRRSTAGINNRVVRKTPVAAPNRITTPNRTTGSTVTRKANTGVATHGRVAGSTVTRSTNVAAVPTPSPAAGSAVTRKANTAAITTPNRTASNTVVRKANPTQKTNVTRNTSAVKPAAPKTSHTTQPTRSAQQTHNAAPVRSTQPNSGTQMNRSVQPANNAHTARNTTPARSARPTRNAHQNHRARSLRGIHSARNSHTTRRIARSHRPTPAINPELVKHGAILQHQEHVANVRSNSATRNRGITRSNGVTRNNGTTSARNDRHGLAHTDTMHNIDHAGTHALRNNAVVHHMQDIYSPSHSLNNPSHSPSRSMARNTDFARDLNHNITDGNVAHGYYDYYGINEVYRNLNDDTAFTRFDGNTAVAANTSDEGEYAFFKRNKTDINEPATTPEPANPESANPAEVSRLNPTSKPAATPVPSSSTTMYMHEGHGGEISDNIHDVDDNDMDEAHYDGNQLKPIKSDGKPAPSRRAAQRAMK